MEGLSQSIAQLVEAADTTQSYLDWMKSALEESLTREAEYEEEINTLKEQVRHLTNHASFLERDIAKLKLHASEYASEYQVIGGYSMTHSYE